VAHIVERNDLNWEIWPGEERMSIMAARVSGLFIWAVTVARFLQEQIDEYGTQCLEEILDALTGEALHDINVLYGLIPRATHPKHATDWDFETFRQIMGAIAVSREPLCLEDLANLLDLRQTPSRPRVDIVNFVRRLRTVLVAGADAVDDKTIPRLHKSFFEFITSPGAFTNNDGIEGHLRIDPRFCIDVNVTEAELALRCLRQFQLFYGKITDDWKTVVSGQLRYACRFWSSHLRHMEGPAMGFVLGGGSSIPDLRERLHLHLNGDSYRPLTLCSSSDRSQLLSTFCGQTYGWDMKTGDRKPRVHTGLRDAWISSVAFSPDGRQLVLGSKDRSLILRDMQTHSLVHTFNGHAAGVTTVAFSPNGNLIASGSNDSTIRLWDPTIPQSVAVLKGHIGRVCSVTFSPDGTTVASSSSTQLFGYGMYNRDSPSDSRYVVILILYGLWCIYRMDNKSFQVLVIVPFVCGIVTPGNLSVEPCQSLEVSSLSRSPLMTTESLGVVRLVSLRGRGTVITFFRRIPQSIYLKQCTLSPFHMMGSLSHLTMDLMSAFAI